MKKVIKLNSYSIIRSQEIRLPTATALYPRRYWIGRWSKRKNKFIYKIIIQHKDGRETSYYTKKPL